MTNTKLKNIGLITLLMFLLTIGCAMAQSTNPLIVKDVTYAAGSMTIAGSNYVMFTTNASGITPDTNWLGKITSGGYTDINDSVAQGILAVGNPDGTKQTWENDKLYVEYVDENDENQSIYIYLPDKNNELINPDGADKLLYVADDGTTYYYENMTGVAKVALDGVDLEISELSITDDLSPGDASTIEVEIKNTGSDSTIASLLVKVYDEDDNDVYTGTKSNIGMSNGDTRTEEFSWTPTVSGNYTLNASVVANDNEADENDNKDTLAFEVTDVYNITNMWVTPTIYTNANLYSAEELEVSGYVTKNGAGVDTSVTISVDGVGILGSASADDALGGYFEFNYDSGITFADNGDTSVTAKIYLDGNTITKSNSTEVVITYTAGDTPEVDMSIDPTRMDLRNGQNFDYLISIENEDDSTGHYTLSFNTHADVEDWLSLEEDRMTLVPDEQEFVSLSINVPSSAKSGEYPITVVLKDVAGRLVDTEKVWITIQGRSQGDPGGLVYSDTSIYNDYYGEGEEYAVDLDADPDNLEVEMGESGEYLLSIRNRGDASDTYRITYNTHSDIKDWFRLSTSTFTLNPGRQKFITLYAEVPDYAEPRSYSLTIKAEGYDTDFEKLDFTVVDMVNRYDVDIGKVSISPNNVFAEQTETVTVSAPVTFRDVSYTGGKYVTVRLYVDKEFVDSKQKYIPSGDTKKVEFVLPLDSEPINDNDGEYDVYLVASVGRETDRSTTQVLDVEKPGEVILTVSTGDYSAKSDESLPIELLVRNTDYATASYKFYSENIDMTLDPTSVTVDGSREKLTTVTATFGNVTSRNYTARIYVEDKNDPSIKDYVEVNIAMETVAGAGEPSESGTGVSPFGATAQLLMSTGGLVAILVGAMLFLLAIGYFYFSKKESLPGENGEGYEEDGTGPQPPGAGENINPLNQIKTFMKSGLDLSKFSHLTKEEPTEMVVEEEVQPTESNPAWNAKNAEAVLENLESIKEDFENTLKNANAVKDNLHNLASDVEKKAGNVSKVLRKTTTKKSKGKKAPVNIKNGYIQSVVDAV